MCLNCQHEELEHLALIEKLCGAIPQHMINKSDYRHKYFDRFDDITVYVRSSANRVGGVCAVVAG
jgi:hypothetical protein